MQVEEHKKKNIPWVEKYRPSTLEDVISHHEIVQTIQNFRDQNKLPNLLLYGPPGTGKTSTIIALAKQMYGTKFGQMVLELNASDERGISTVRETIKSFAESQSFSFVKEKSSLTKLVILDEADAMTSAAQFALRRIIEKYARTTRFCFICNYVSKIIPAIQSRCTRFKFKQIPILSAKERIASIASKEGINLTEDAILSIFNLCDGDMRRVVNMLQSISLSSSENTLQEIDSKYVYQFTGMARPDLIKNILCSLLDIQNLQSTYQDIRTIMLDNGISLQLLLRELNQQILECPDMTESIRINIIDRMADLEYRLSLNCNDQIQILSLIGVFYEQTK